MVDIFGKYFTNKHIVAFGKCFGDIACYRLFSIYNKQGFVNCYCGNQWYISYIKIYGDRVISKWYYIGKPNYGIKTSRK